MACAGHSCLCLLPLVLIDNEQLCEAVPVLCHYFWKNGKLQFFFCPSLVEDYFYCSFVVCLGFVRFFGWGFSSLINVLNRLFCVDTQLLCPDGKTMHWGVGVIFGVCLVFVLSLFRS